MYVASWSIVGFVEQNMAPQNESTVTCKDKDKSQRKGKSPKIKSMWSEDEAFIYASVLSSIVKMEETSLGL